MGVIKWKTKQRCQNYSPIRDNTNVNITKYTVSLHIPSFKMSKISLIAPFFLIYICSLVNGESIPVCMKRSGEQTDKKETDNHTEIDSTLSCPSGQFLVAVDLLFPPGYQLQMNGSSLYVHFEKEKLIYDEGYFCETKGEKGISSIAVCYSDKSEEDEFTKKYYTLSVF